MKESKNHWIKEEQIDALIKVLSELKDEIADCKQSIINSEAVVLDIEKKIFKERVPSTIKRFLKLPFNK